MSLLLSFIGILLSLLLVVGLHEAGHALAARAFNVTIRRISIGFGKPLLKWRQKNGPEWVWALWPLGGYVQLLNSRIEPVSPEDDEHCFDKQAIWKRVIILLAGAAANLIVAWIFLMVVYMHGYSVHAAIVGKVSSPSIASEARLSAGDRLVRIYNQPVSSWRDAATLFIMNLGKNKVSLDIKTSKGEIRKTSLNLKSWQYKYHSNALLGGMGIEPAVVREQVQGVSFTEAFQTSLRQMKLLLVFFLVTLKQIITGTIPFAVLLGPLGLLMEMAQSFSQSMVMFCYFIANLSLAVALINLLPIPGLDGGSLLYAGIEKIRGKPLSIALEVLLYRLAFIIFCVFLINLIMNDIQRYWQ